MKFIALFILIAICLWFYFEIKNAPIVYPDNCDDERVKKFGCEGVCKPNPPCTKGVHHE